MRRAHGASCGVHTDEFGPEFDEGANGGASLTGGDVDVAELAFEIGIRLPAEYVLEAAVARLVRLRPSAAIDRVDDIRALSVQLFGGAEERTAVA